MRNNLVVKNIREPDHSDDLTEEAEAYVYYGGILEADEDEEVMLYDFNNILAAIGGSLGLFLGVSVFSIIVSVMDKCSTIIERKMKKSSKKLSIKKINVI